MIPEQYAQLVYQALKDAYGERLDSFVIDGERPSQIEVRLRPLPPATINFTVTVPEAGPQTGGWLPIHSRA